MKWGQLGRPSPSQDTPDRSVSALLVTGKIKIEFIITRLLRFSSLVDLRRKSKFFLLSLFWFSYNPYDGPNEHPEAELPLVAGKYLYVYGSMDDDGFYEGKQKCKKSKLTLSCMKLVLMLLEQEMAFWMAVYSGDLHLCERVMSLH